MSAPKIIPFDFEEQAVRVVMRDGEPWFVAADVCRVLEIENTTNAVKRLDGDEAALYSIKGSQRREATIISESGLYALVFTSRKEQAKKFRKWITSEVLPSIRKHGRYEHRITGNESQAGFGSEGDFAGMSFREAEMWLQSVREARLTQGTRAAIRIWDRSPLPSLHVVPVADNPADPENGLACLSHLLAQMNGAIAAARDGFTDVGRDHLSAHMLRACEDGLFVANCHLGVFAGTQWAGGAHRAALKSLDGVVARHLTLAGYSTRGTVVPWALVDSIKVGFVVEGAANA